MTPVAVVTWEPVSNADAAALERDGIVLARWFDQRYGGHGTSEHPLSGAGRRQVEYLASRGHRRIAFACPTDQRVRLFADARLEGVREACRLLGLPSPVVASVGVDLEAAVAAVRSWTRPDQPVTAVCAYNDEVAFALLAASRRLGMAVPDTIAVIGIEDIPTAQFADPPLTTVALDNEPHVRHLVASLVAHLQGLPPPSPFETADHRVIVRESA